MAAESETAFLGRWKSGRTWKTPTDQKASKKIVTKGVKGHSWTEKLAQRQQRTIEKALLKELAEANASKQARLAKQREESRKRKEYAAQQAIQNTAGQVISNSKKLKRMSKKEYSKLIKK